MGGVKFGYKPKDHPAVPPVNHLMDTVERAVNQLNEERELRAVHDWEDEVVRGYERNTS